MCRRTQLHDALVGSSLNYLAAGLGVHSPFIARVTYGCPHQPSTMVTTASACDPCRNLDHHDVAAWYDEGWTSVGFK